MGQKSSKKVDLYITDNVTHCKLPDEKLKTYSGRPREYTAIDVKVENGNTAEQNASSKSNSSSSSRSHHSILTVLSKAHRKSYHLAFVIPKVKGSKPSTLVRNSFIEEETNEIKEDDDVSAKDKPTDLTHTIFLLRPKVKSRLKKEFSLKRMEATKTFLNVMLDIQHKWGFSVKEFSGETSSIATGKYMEKLQDMISSEASKDGRLLSVMRVKSEKESNNGTANGSEKEKDDEENAEEKQPSQLTLQMVFLYKYGEYISPSFQYTVTCHQTKCTEQALNLKKKKQPTPKSLRDTNITWSEDWLGMFKDDSRLTEVIYVGEQSPSQPEASPTSKSKKAKPREFEVCTLCFYEKPINKKKTDVTDKQEEAEVQEDTTSYPEAYDGLIREVWAPIDENIQASLENEASTYGEFGWELCTVLVTSHVRMKTDGSEFRKCAIFFQRPKPEHVPETEMDKSRENLLQDDNVLVEGASDPQTEYLNDTALPSSPKEKVERFGVPILKAGDLDLTKLKSTSKLPSESQKKDDQAPANALPAFQLKKVDRQKLKKPEVSEESTAAQQVKLRPTGTKEKLEKKDAGKEVPWMSTLEKKREAVMKREESTQSENRPSSGEAEGEIAQKIDELKEKRAERQNRLSHPRKESMEKEKGDTKKDEKAEAAVEQESKDPAVLEAIEDSTIEPCEKEKDEGVVESKKVESGTGYVEKTLEKTEDYEKMDVNDPETNKDAIESIPTQFPETVSSTQFKDLPSPPPVVTPPRGNETAISHLHLPSPPPVTDDLSPKSEEDFPYPPNDENELQEIDNSENVNRADNEVIKKASSNDSLSIEKQISNESDVLDFPIPPPSDLLPAPASVVTDESNPTKETMEKDSNKNDRLESQSTVVAEPMVKTPKISHKEEKETKEEDEIKRLDEVDQTVAETETAAAITEPTSTEDEMRKTNRDQIVDGEIFATSETSTLNGNPDDKFTPSFLEDTVGDKPDSSLTKEMDEKISFNASISPMQEEAKVVLNNSESEIPAQTVEEKVNNTTEDIEKQSCSNAVSEKDKIVTSSQTFEPKNEENVSTIGSNTENGEETKTPPPSPCLVEEKSAIQDFEKIPVPEDVPDESTDDKDSIKTPQNDKSSLEDLKEPLTEEVKTERMDGSQSDEKNEAEANDNKNLPDVNDSSAEQKSTNTLSNEGQTDLKEASEDSKLSNNNTEENVKTEDN